MFARLFPGLLATALAVLALPSPGRAQDAPAEPGADEQRPLELLLEQRESLALTSEQLSRLEGIRTQLASANEPLVSRMMALRKEWQQQRQTTRRGGAPQSAARLDRIRSDAEPLRARIRQNNQRAMQEVNRLLTRDQRARLRGMVEERRRQERVRPPAGRRSGAGARE
jgi:hypothetical protein